MEKLGKKQKENLLNHTQSFHISTFPPYSTRKPYFTSPASGDAIAVCKFTLVEKLIIKSCGFSNMKHKAQIEQLKPES